MFDSISIREHSSGETDEPLDMGFLAECLLFYQQVRVIGPLAVLRQLVPALGPEVLLELIERGWLKVSYLETLGGIFTQNAGTQLELHKPVPFTLPVYELQKAAPRIFTEAIGRSGRGRRLANRFTSLVEVLPYDEKILQAMRVDLLSPESLELSVRGVLRVLAPEYQLPAKLIADVSEVEGAFTIRTNINFAEANASYHKRIPPRHSSLSTAYLLALLLNTRESLTFASHFSSELATSPAISTLLQLKVESLVSDHVRSLDRLSQFQDFVFEDGRAVREAINSGERTFADILKLLEEGEKFKQWLKGQKPDANLCKAYHQAVTKETWIDKLPTKTLRWALFTGAGLGIDLLGAGGIGTAVGLGLSAADNFLLERLINGWKPDQFVEGAFRQFARRDS